MNPLTRLFAALASVVVLVASLFIGAVVALVALGFVVLGWMAFIIRRWQLRRQGPPPGSTTIEGDYRVVHDTRDEDRQ